ncbi:MAG: beta-N-acetylhexosaminidase [Siphonobacter aquaeclarae]|nr:beta-N-acetylhexosaminidase [Siphonobacter aquaeclarae]
MQRLLLFLLAAAAGSGPSFAQTTHSLLPAPKTVRLQEGQLRLRADFRIGVSAPTGDSLLFRAVNRTRATLNRRTGLYFEQETIAPGDTAGLFRVIVTQKQVALPGADEGYHLLISPSGAKLQATTTTGALRGLQTVLQLAQQDSAGYYLPSVVIDDAPRFAWRGLMLDVARHFLPLEALRRNIDAMAVVKLNVLHLHLSDDEGFRVESKRFPELQRKGSLGQFYTQTEIRELVRYAADRGIVIVPEFDMPGHTTAMLAAYPALASAPGPYQPGPRFRRGDKPLSLPAIMQMIQTTPTPAIDPSREAIYAFLDSFFGEMAGLFPSPWMHIGADENNGVSWKNNPAIVRFMQQQKLADTHALQAYFVRRVHAILRKHNRKTVGWEELAGGPKDLIVQAWSDTAYFHKAVRNNSSILVSKGFYLDLFYPAHAHYRNDLLDASPLVMGGEAALWSEIVDAGNQETRTWPRTGSIAERLWSPATQTDSDDLYRRLFRLSTQLDELGIDHIGQYERSLRRLAGADAGTLRNLTDILTPVKGYRKLFARLSLPERYTVQSAPLTAVSDIVFVDSEVKRNFRQLVSNWLSTKKNEDSIRVQLIRWKTLAANIRPIPGLEPAIQAHAQRLEAIAGSALEALERRKAGTLTPEWVAQQRPLFAAAGKADGSLELSIVKEIEALISGELAPEPTSYPMF